MKNRKMENRKMENRKVKTEENLYLKHYSILSNIFYFVKYFKKYEPVVLICCVIEIVLSAILPLIGIYLPKITLDLVTNQVDIGHAILVLGLFTLLMMGVYGINTAVGSGKYYLYNTQRTNIIGLLFLKSLRIRYEDTESGEIKRRLVGKLKNCFRKYNTNYKCTLFFAVFYGFRFSQHMDGSCINWSFSAQLSD